MPFSKPWKRHDDEGPASCLPARAAADAGEHGFCSQSVGRAVSVSPGFLFLEARQTFFRMSEQAVRLGFNHFLGDAALPDTYSTCSTYLFSWVRFRRAVGADGITGE